MAKGYGKGGRGCVSPLGGASRPPEILRGGGSTGPFSARSPISSSAMSSSTAIATRRLTRI
jgi:hypothetical protein